MHGSPRSPWRTRDFRALWIAHGVSVLGSQVTFLALPLVAIVTLRATPLQMGLLGATSGAPVLLFGLLIGVWVDRHRRRPALIASDLCRAALLLIVPLAVVAGVLHLGLLLLLAFLIGALSLVFDVAAQALLPILVPRERLTEANSNLELGRSAAGIAGPGVAGGIVQLVTAPFALLADAASFVISALLLASIRVVEPPRPHNPESRVREEIGEGVRWVWHHPVLRPLIGATGILAFFNSLLEAVDLLYLTRRLVLAPAVVGAIFALSGLGFLLGAVMAGRIVRRIGAGRALVLALVLVGFGDLAVPLVGGPLRIVVLVLIAAQACFGVGLAAFKVIAATLRQGSAPDRLQGRMNATVRLLVEGLTPLGSLAGGVLGQGIGLRPTLLIAVGGELLAALWLLCSSVRRVGASARW
jgi:MFS family permease